MFCKSKQTQGKISSCCHQLWWFQNLLDHLSNKFWINVPKSPSYFVNEELLVLIKNPPSVCFPPRYYCIYIFIYTQHPSDISTPHFVLFCYIKAEVDFFFPSHNPISSSFWRQLFSTFTLIFFGPPHYSFFSPFTIEVSFVQLVAQLLWARVSGRMLRGRSAASAFQ